MPFTRPQPWRRASEWILAATTAGAAACLLAYRLWGRNLVQRLYDQDGISFFVVPDQIRSRATANECYEWGGQFLLGLAGRDDRGRAGMDRLAVRRGPAALAHAQADCDGLGISLSGCRDVVCRVSTSVRRRPLVSHRRCDGLSRRASVSTSSPVYSGCPGDRIRGSGVDGTPGIFRLAIPGRRTGCLRNPGLVPPHVQPANEPILDLR